MAPAKYCVKCT